MLLLAFVAALLTLLWGVQTVVRARMDVQDLTSISGADEERG